MPRRYLLDPAGLALRNSLIEADVGQSGTFGAQSTEPATDFLIHPRKVGGHYSETAVKI
jgi:hypothetical protein